MKFEKYDKVRIKGTEMYYVFYEYRRFGSPKFDCRVYSPSIHDYLIMNSKDLEKVDRSVHEQLTLLSLGGRYLE